MSPISQGHERADELGGRTGPDRCRDPLHCVVPPYVLRNIAEHGDDEQRRWAAAALERDARIRQARVENALVRGDGPREGADALAVTATVAPNRTIRDAQNGEAVGGPILRSEGDPPCGDVAADEAYDGFGDTFEFFRAEFGRNSIDDEGMPLRGVVHFGFDYGNAFWDGRRMVFGDGDGSIFSRLTKSLDVIGHELAHGVTEDEARLRYSNQSGALNESMSDVFGSLVRQRKLGQTAAQADWLIGKDVWTPGVGGDALRSMKAPGTAYDHPLVGKDPQPDHMRDLYTGPGDYGGVHINSGIPNKAFYVAAREIGGHAWEAPGRIWYRSLRHRDLRPTSRFARFAGITLRVAAQMFGAGSDERRAVRAGWEAVGVEPQNPA